MAITGTITHTVTLSTSGTYASPLTIDSGGYVSASGTAVYGPNSHAWTVVNYGKINGTSGAGVRLKDGGNVANSGTAARISGYSGITIYSAAGTVTNAGTIQGTGKFGVYLLEGSVSNNSTGLIKGADQGIEIYDTAGTVTNAGTITGASDGIYFHQGGSVANSGIISGGYGILASFVSTAAATVTNSGTIHGTDAIGVDLVGGGSVANTSSAALIYGASDGISIGGTAGAVTNVGTIRGADDGVDLSGTLTNSGTIIGGNYGDAVRFGGATNRLIVDPGAVFVRYVAGNSGGSNTLELASAASTGTIAGINAAFGTPDAFRYFGTVIIDAGAKWDFVSSETITNNGTTFYITGDTITNGGTLEIGSSATASGTITFGGNNRVVVDPVRGVRQQRCRRRRQRPGAGLGRKHRHA